MIATGNIALSSYMLSEIDFRNEQLILARKFQVEAEMRSINGIRTAKNKL